MNERIRELLEQVVRIEIDPDSKCETIYTCEPDDFEAFAELIVQECIELVASRPYIDDGNWSHPSMLIKRHFGVEE